ncbi:MAG TPA: AIR synthase family protein [Chloroflexota bacterium]|nr:AIR synthase family protein [Chloroflexota bacterium]
MRTGKLAPELLARLLKTIPRGDPRVLLAGSVGEDAAALDFMGDGSSGSPDDSILVAKTDPITFATDHAGWYAVHVNANDVACTGAAPRWFLASALLPETWEERDVERLFAQIVEACQSLGASLVGGHTEVTGGIDRPLIAGTMLGEVPRRRLIRTGGGRAGDALILTQGIAIEGTSVLAREAAETLRERGLTVETIERAQQLLFEPGISVVRAARVLGDALPEGALHSLHDPTEGGLATGLWELAHASDCGALVEESAVPVLPETRAMCDALGLESWGLLASGSLLAAVEPANAQAAVQALRAASIPAAVVGYLTPPSEGIKLRRAAGDAAPWPTFERDEIARYFDS